MLQAGAGRIGDYDSCCWQTKGRGQFRPLESSNAFSGRVGEIGEVDEWKLEMVCEENLIRDVIAAMKKAHPYETPAYGVVKSLEF